MVCTNNSYIHCYHLRSTKMFSVYLFILSFLNIKILYKRTITTSNEPRACRRRCCAADIWYKAEMENEGKKKIIEENQKIFLPFRRFCGRTTKMAMVGYAKHFARISQNYYNLIIETKAYYIKTFMSLNKNKPIRTINI
jgi:hypothetical protein